MALSRLSWALLGASAVQFAVLLGINVVVFVEGGDGSSAVVFMSPFVFLLSLDAVLRKNSIQICNVVLSNFWLLFYTIVRLVELIVYNRSNLETYTQLYGPISFALPVVQLATVLVTQITLLYISIKLYRVWGWSFVKAGDDRPRVRAARAYQIYISLLCASFLYIIHGAISPFITLRNSLSEITPFVALFMYLPVAIVLIVEVLALRFEKKWLCWVLVPFGVVACAFVAGIVLVGDIAIGQINRLSAGQVSEFVADCRGNVNRTRCAKLTIPIQWSNVIFFNAALPIYLARFILGLVSWHWMGREIHKPAEVAVARDMKEMGSPAPTAIPVDNSQEIAKESTAPVASGGAL